MFDSSGKIVEGLLNGNTNIEGSFSSCYQIHATQPTDSNGTELDPFRGRFCTLRLLSSDEDEDLNQLFGLPSLSPQTLQTVSFLDNDI